MLKPESLEKQVSAQKAPRKINDDENLVIIGAIIDLLFNEKIEVTSQSDLVNKLIDTYYPITNYISKSTLTKNFTAANNAFKVNKKI
jgi:hypothetical protein